MPAEPSTATADVDANPLWGRDWPEVRALWPLEATVAHLNHGSYGAVPTPVLEEQQSWRDRMESNPVRFFARELPDALDQARAEVAQFLGADAERSLASCTTPPPAPARCSPASRSRRATRSWSPTTLRSRPHRRCPLDRRAGARVDTVHVPLDADDASSTEAVLASVHERTRLVVLDQVTSPTARRMPWSTSSPPCRSAGSR